MQITKELVEYISALSKIELNKIQIDKMQTELGAIVEYMEILNKVNTDGISLDYQIFPISNVLRDDKVSPSFSREDILKNASEHDDRNFIVPKTIE